MGVAIQSPSFASEYKADDRQEAGQDSNASHPQRRADGGARDAVKLDTELVKRAIGADVICPLGATPFQYQSDPITIDNFGVSSLTPPESSQRREREGARPEPRRIPG